MGERVLPNGSPLLGPHDITPQHARCREHSWSRRTAGNGRWEKQCHTISASWIENSLLGSSRQRTRWMTVTPTTAGCARNCNLPTRPAYRACQDAAGRLACGCPLADSTLRHLARMPAKQNPHGRCCGPCGFESTDGVIEGRRREPDLRGGWTQRSVGNRLRICSWPKPREATAMRARGAGRFPVERS